MKNRPVRRVLTIGLSLVVAGTLAACSSGGSSSPGASGSSLQGWNPDNSRPANEVHVLVLGDAAAAAEKALATEFNKTSKVKVVIDTGSTAGADYNTQVRSQIGTKNGPDVFMSWGAAGINPLVQAKGLLPLNTFIKQQPKLKSMFVPSVFNGEVIDGQAYGIPMRGVAPEFLYYNKKVLADAGLKPATTYDDFLSQVQTLKGKGVIPVALGGADLWPDQIWFQYAYTRIMGNAELSKGLAGDKSVWSSAASKKATAMVSSLIKAGAFGSNFGSVHYSADGSPALLRTGKAAYELMGSWNYATIGDVSNIGWIAFPSVSGGAGNPSEITGNLSNYYNVAANTRYPNTVRDFLTGLYSPSFQKAELALGNLPPTTDAATYVASDNSLDASAKAHLTFVSNLVQKAPSFVLSWDQIVPATQQTTLQKLFGNFFSGSVNDDQFISQMQTITSSK